MKPPTSKSITSALPQRRGRLSSDTRYSTNTYAAVYGNAATGPNVESPLSLFLTAAVAVPVFSVWDACSAPCAGALQCQRGVYYGASPHLFSERSQPGKIEYGLLWLVPFRPHTRYMWEALQHAASVCVLSKPLRFDYPDGKQFTRALPTPVCLVSFDTDLAPSARHTVTTASFARMRTCDALFNNATQMVLQCTGSTCEIVGSAIDAFTLRNQCATT